MAKIGIIDADLIGRSEHNFPNLVCMKLSGYHKNIGDEVKLISYNDIDPNAMFSEVFEKVYISKVFTDTYIPEFALKLPFVEYGGTGFYYDNAAPLPDEIEHTKPDYNLYNEWIKEKIRTGKKKSYFKEYTDYSLGYTTRGCFRKCEFCVNKKYNKVYLHSPLIEFVDITRKKICLLDDNIFGCGEHWENILNWLSEIKIPFKYKQGLDIRLLSEKKAQILSKCKYDGDFTFAFDNISDTNLIIKKIKIFKKYMPKVVPKLYVFCAFDRTGIYDRDFWINDIIDVFKRIKILMEFSCLPYLMKFEKWNTNLEFKSIYTLLSSWCNQVSIFKKMSFRQYHGENNHVRKFERNFPDIANEYFDLKFKEIEKNN